MSTAIKAIILYQLELHGNVLFGIWWSFHANHSHGHVIRKCICLQLLCKWYSYFKWDVSGRNRLGCICESWFGISKQQPLFELLLLTFCLNWKPGLINRGVFPFPGKLVVVFHGTVPPPQLFPAVRPAANDCTLQRHWTSGFVAGVGMPWQAMMVTVTSQLASKELGLQWNTCQGELWQKILAFLIATAGVFISCVSSDGGVSDEELKGNGGLLKGDIRNCQSITFTVFSWSKPITGTAQIHGGGRKRACLHGGSLWLSLIHHI